MNYSFFSAVFLLFVLGACSPKQHAQQEVPSCIKAMIEEFKSQPVQNPPIEVWQWIKDDGEVFYYVTSPCCDQYNYVHNTDCEQVCAPSGGYTGKGDGKCPDLEENVVQNLIWKDERKLDQQAIDANMLNGKMEGLKRMAKANSCDETTKFKFTAYGSKACGGPQGFMPYSSEINEAEFLAKVEQYNQAEKNYNIKYKVVSNCMVEMPPQRVVCVDGKPSLDYGNERIGNLQ